MSNLKKTLIFIEEKRGLYAETFVASDKEWFKTHGYEVKEIYLSDLKVGLWPVALSFFHYPVKCLLALALSFSAYDRPKRILGNLHALLLFLSSFNELGGLSKNAEIRTHFLAKRFTFAYFFWLFWKSKISCVAHARDIFEWDNSIKYKLISATKVDCISNFNIGYINGKTKFRFSDKLNLRRNRLGRHFPEKKEAAKVDYGSVNFGRNLRFVTVCRLVKKKGLLDILNFLKTLPSSFIIHWDIVGDGPCGTDLKTEISNIGFDTNVTFHGLKTPKEVTRIISTADYFVMFPRLATSKDMDMDGIPTVYQESLSIGVPVVTTDVSGIPELIRDGINGVLVSPTDDTESRVEKFLIMHTHGFEMNTIKLSLGYF